MGSNLRFLLLTVMIIVCAMAILSTNDLATGESLDPFPNIPLIIYSNAYSIDKEFDHTNGKKAVTFKVTTPFPAEAVTRFYDSEIERRGFKKIKNDIAKSVWEDFDLQKGEWLETPKVPAKYTSWWTDDNKKILLILSMFYKYDAKNTNWPSTLYVFFSVNNFPASELKSMGIEIK